MERLARHAQCIPVGLTELSFAVAQEYLLVKSVKLIADYRIAKAVESSPDLMMAAGNRRSFHLTYLLRASESPEYCRNLPGIGRKSGYGLHRRKTLFFSDEA
jgi:hypothetical protein